MDTGRSEGCFLAPKRLLILCLRSVRARCRCCTQGTNILLAQYIFLGLYLAFIAVLMLIYHEAKVVRQRAAAGAGAAERVPTPHSSSLCCRKSRTAHHS